jgi:hypothetical protein
MTEMCEAIVAETTAWLLTTALRGTMFPCPNAAIYMEAMQKTTDFAVERASARILGMGTPLATLNKLLAKNEAARSELAYSPWYWRMSDYCKRNVMEKALLWKWTNDILEAAIVMHGDMHVLENA